MSCLESLEAEVGNFPSSKPFEQLSDEIDYLLLEDSTSAKDRTALRKLRLVLQQKNQKVEGALNETNSSEAEIFDQQMRMMYDCEKAAKNAGAQIQANTQKLAKANQTSLDLNGKLLSSANLVQNLRAAFARHRLVFKVVFLCVGLMAVTLVAFRLS